MVASEHDGLGAYHSPIVGFFFRMFVNIEHRRKRAVIERRYSMILEQRRAATNKPNDDGDGLDSKSNGDGANASSAIDVDHDDENLGRLVFSGQTIAALDDGADTDEPGENDNTPAAVHERDLVDPSEMVGRQAAAYIDLGLGCALPALYLIYLVTRTLYVMHGANRLLANRGVDVSDILISHHDERDT